MPRRKDPWPRRVPLLTPGDARRSGDGGPGTLWHYFTSVFPGADGADPDDPANQAREAAFLALSSCQGARTFPVSLNEFSLTRKPAEAALLWNRAMDALGYDVPEKLLKQVTNDDTDKDQ